MWTRAPVAVLLATSLTCLACVPCGGVKYATATLSGRFERAAGGPLTGEATFSDMLAAGSGSGGLWWERAIHDASTVPSALGLFRVGSPEETLDLVMPFPLSIVQELPIVTAAVLENVGGQFVDVTGRSVSLYPSDMVGAWFWDQPSPSCTRATPEACATEQAFKRQQAASGTMRVTSVSPLVLRFDGMVSYPADSGRAPTPIAGDVTFAVSHGDSCYDP